MKPKLNIELLCEEANIFSEAETAHADPFLYGVTDGKAVGTYFEHKFQKYLHQKYQYNEGSSAKGIDFPGLNVDTNATSVKQPQSSCPYKSASQKIYGLGYSLLIFVYEKSDDNQTATGQLNIKHTVFVNQHRTADFQMTTGLRQIIENNGNEEDIMSFLQDRNLPLDEIGAKALAEEILSNPPEIGHLTISNALQWRLQYKRVIQSANSVDGIIRVR